MLTLRRILALSLLCFLNAPYAQTALARAPSISAKPLLNIQKVTSPQHGLTAWLVEDHNLPLISISFAFKGAGSAQDPEGKQGLVRLLSNTMDEGAGDLTSEAFQKTLNDLSITLTYSADRDDFSGQLTTLTRYQDEAFKLLALSLTQPRFDADPLARMVAANQARIRSSLSNPQWRAARLMNVALFGDHPYARNSGGTLSSLASITPDDLRAYQTKALAQDNLIVSVAGDITPDALGDFLDTVFANLPTTATLNEIPDVSFDFKDDLWLHPYDTPQSVVMRLQKGASPHDPDYAYAQIFNQILGASGFGSRLMDSLREQQGLTYGIYSSLNHYDHANFMLISTSTKNESADVMISGIDHELRNFEQNPISPQELGAARRFLLGQLPLELTSNTAISQALLAVQQSGLPIDYLDQNMHAIHSVTLVGIRDFSTRFLDGQHATTIVVGAPEGVTPTHVIETLPDVE